MPHQPDSPPNGKTVIRREYDLQVELGKNLANLLSALGLALIERYSDQKLEALEDRIMSKLSDKLAEVEASQDAALARVQEDVAAQAAKIADLEAKVAEGTATAEDLATLDRIKAKNDALDPIKPDTISDVPAGP